VPAPTGASSAIANTAIGQQTRSQNALRYTTPSISGFTALVTYSTSQGGSEGNMGDVGKGRLISGALNYAAGPIRAGLSVLDSTVENRTAGAAIASPGDQKAMSAVLGYDFGMGTVGLGLDRSTVTTGAVGGATTDTKRNSWSVPVTFKLGAGTLLATYSRANDTNLAADSGANMWSVGYEHPLSKRTTLGVSYVRLDNKSAGIYGLYTQASLIGGAGQTIGQDASQFYVGVRHTF
jgi:predicted porin